MPEIGDTQNPRPRVIQNPVCGSEIEAWLKGHGVNHLRCIEIPVARIDKKKSRHNQARPQPLIQETVDICTLGYKRGDDLPPIVVYRESERSTTFIVIDGNNRHEGADKAGLEMIPAYIVASDTPAEKILLLTVEANSGHGVRTPEDWRIKQALQLLAIGGDNTVEEICKAANITEAQLKMARRVAEIDQRVRPLKISGWLDLSITNRHKLGQITSDRVLFNAAHLVISTEMKSKSDVGALVRAVKAMHSEEEQVLFVQAETAKRRKEMAEKKALAKNQRTLKAGVKNSLASGIGLIMNVDEAAFLRIAITDTERQEMKQRMDACVEKLFSLLGALEQVMNPPAEGVA